MKKVIGKYVLFAVGCGVAMMLVGCNRRDVAAITQVEANERGSALYKNAMNALQAGQIDESITLLQKVLLNEPRAYSAHFQLATLLHDYKSDYIGAIYHYRQYLALRPDSEKTTVARERERLARQLLAPQILREVGDSVQGISAAHLLKENEKLQQEVTRTMGERAAARDDLAALTKMYNEATNQNARLRVRVRALSMDDSEDSLSDLPSLATLQGEDGATEAPIATTDELRAMRRESESLAEVSGGEAKPVDPALKGRSTVEAFGLPQKKAPTNALPPRPKTYTVEQGDTLFRISERFYGTSSKWRAIRDANRGRIDVDGRVRLGQEIVLP